MLLTIADADFRVSFSLCGLIEIVPLLLPLCHGNVLYSIPFSSCTFIEPDSRISKILNKKFKVKHLIGIMSQVNKIMLSLPRSQEADPPLSTSDFFTLKIVAVFFCKKKKKNVLVTLVIVNLHLRKEAKIALL